MPASGRRFPAWALVSLAWLGPAILGGFEAYMQAKLDGRSSTWRSFAFHGGDWLIYGLLTPAVFALGRRFPVSRGSLLRAIPVHLAASIVLCAAWAGLGTVLRHVLQVDVVRDLEGELIGWFLTTLPFGVAVYFAVLGVQHAVAYFTQTTLLSHQLAEARLAALRVQMHPHFLYNSLNAATVIVRDRDSQTATRMLEMLGEMLHRVMRADRPQEVPLAEELDFVRQYLAIEEIRFSDRLRPVFAVDDGVLRAAVPDFVLQPLVENALRHGLAKRVSATLLEIGARREGSDLVLTVTDDGPGPDATTVGSLGVGLGNTRERLATLYGARARLDLVGTPGGGARATVRIPYHETGRVDG